MPTPNPYPEIMVGEISGVKVPDERHRIWDEGYEAGQRDLIEQIGRAKIAKVLSRGVFPSKQALVTAIMDYIRKLNEEV